MEKKIDSLNYAFVGAGNMAKGMMKALQCKGVPYNRLSCSVRSKKSMDLIKKESKFPCFLTNDFVRQADIVFICVKPNDLFTVAEQIKNNLHKKQLIISILAGIKLSVLRKCFPQVSNVIRSMPNLPSFCFEGIIAYSALEENKEDINLIKKVFSLMGLCLKVNEELINPLTALTGSGPAYVVEFLIYFRNYALKYGFSQDLSKLLAIKVFQGSLAMLKNDSSPLEVIRDYITSPKGTTEAALNDMKKNNMAELFDSFFESAKKRADQIYSGVS